MTAVSELETLDLLHRLPDTVLLKTSEAAVLLRTSVRSLERLRQSAGGPPYMQGGAQGASGANQKCLYRKGDLLEWVESNMVSSNVEAAIRKGQLFRTIHDLAEERPYWVDATGKVSGAVENTEVGDFLKRMGNPMWEIEWLSAEESSLRSWDDLDAKRQHTESVERVLSNALGVVRGALEKDEFERVAREGSKPDGGKI